MGFSSLHGCMESSPDHWLQGTIHEESGMDSSLSPSGNMITCSRPTTEMRRLVRPPPQDQALNKCPRCDSGHTKFCYYNNYSLSQPRYFCKSCRRYWTKGGTLRNIPVGGSFRKNTKKASNSSKKSNNQQPSPTINQNKLAHPIGAPSDYNYQDVQFSHINNLLGTTNIGGALLGNPSNMGVFENHRPMNYDFFGVNSDNVGVSYNIDGNVFAQSYQGLCSSAFGGMSLNGGSSSYDIMDSSYQNMIDVKPNPRILSLEWQDHVEGPGSWTRVTNGYGSSTTNPVI